MRVRTSLTAVLVGALATAGALAGTAPAHAAYTADPDDTHTGSHAFGPQDLVGTGSDTTQHALKLLADAWNNQSPAPDFEVGSYAATGGGTLPNIGDISRPNGSGAGRTALYTGAGVANLDFARSSSNINGNDITNGLTMLPFAQDTVVAAVSSSTPSNAPANLTIQQLVQIYKGEVTNWQQLGGANAPIIPALPQSNSGTEAFFVQQLTAANNGTAITQYPETLVRVQEHDPAPIRNNPNIIAPFSKGRAELAGTVRVVGGFFKDRAVFNVVRNADVNDPEVQAFFGPNGFVCSDAAQGLIEQAGFEQLARPNFTQPGVCGVANTTAPTNMTLNGDVDPIPTEAVVSGTSKEAGKVTLAAAISSDDGTPEGTVTFFEGENAVATNVPVVGGTATRTITATPGKHTYVAVYTPTFGTLFQASETPGTAVTVKAKATITETFPATVKKGAKAKGVVTVTLSGTSAKATKTVLVKKGKKIVGKGTLRAGKVTITLSGLTKGRNALVISWAGDANGVAATKKITITQK